MLFLIAFGYYNYESGLHNTADYYWEVLLSGLASIASGMIEIYLDTKNDKS